MKWRGVDVVLLLAIAGFCLFEDFFQRDCGLLREFEVALIQTQWAVLICLVTWSCTFLFLTFSLDDLPLICLLLIAIAAYYIGYSACRLTSDASMLLFGVTLGRGARLVLQSASRRESASPERSQVQIQESLNHSGLTSATIFLIGIVVMLAFSSWWRLDMANNFYNGPRWMGLWNNPNDFGMLMSTGLTLAIGLLASNDYKLYLKSSPPALRSIASEDVCPPPCAEPQRRMFLRPLRSFVAVDVALLIAAVMMSVGLLFSYSRGSWLGAAIGVLYLAKVSGKFKWQYVLPATFVVAIVVVYFWNATPNASPWYIRRMDLGRASAQHRVAAWKAGIEIMRDHPLGVGWNRAVEVYETNYSPPENGAMAVTTNDYVMLGTQLGLPGLICFVTHCVLYFKTQAAKIKLQNSGFTIKTACRGGALAMLVAFWFDGGLFKLATASVFWILLELSKEEAHCKMSTIRRRSLSHCAI